MKRNRFLTSMLGLGLIPLWGCQTKSNKANKVPSENSPELVGASKSVTKLKQDLVSAWNRSEKMTMANVEQMPPELFTYKYTDEAMTFAEQWRHCIMYTCGQLAARAGLQNPYENIKLPIQMPKDHVIKELQNMYVFVRKSIMELSQERLHANCDFAGESVPVWRLFLAMENHIIHHRGQCVVYLRLMGVVPKGYYGW